MWQDGLFYTLFTLGIDSQIWRLMREFYCDFKCFVRIGNVLSDGFDARQGIHQGAPCSMFLYEVFTSKMLEQLQKSSFSLNVYGFNVCSPAYADDLTLISLSEEGLRALLSLVYKYSLKWRFQFNPDKCKIMVFGNQSIQRSFYIGKNVINESSCETLLGVPIVTKTSSEVKYYRKRITKCKNMCYASQAIGSYNVPVTPVTSTKLYWSTCVPKLCYGMEINSINDDTKEDFETFHFGMAKHCQVLPKNAANFGALYGVGWKTLEAHCDIIRLTFL